MERALDLVNFGLVVLIWLVQIVIYPAFAAIDAAEFRTWHARYTTRVTWIVAPLMFLQLGLLTARAGGALLGYFPEASLPLAVAALLLAGGCWAATFFVSVPLHNALAAQGRNAALIARLVQTNWIRTGLWSALFLLDAAGG